MFPKRKPKVFFVEMSADAADTVLGDLRADNPALCGELARHVANWYYQQDAVLLAIGLEARAPFPRGYDVAAGDLSLLEPVRARAAIYRDVDD